jgi:hypothetical protein
MDTGLIQNHGFIANMLTQIHKELPKESLSKALEINDTTKDTTLQMNIRPEAAALFNLQKELYDSVESRDFIPGICNFR